jgi:hypothetical protein
LFEARSEVVYDGVQVPPLAGDAERQSLRQELGLPANQTIVVLAGQVAEVKASGTTSTPLRAHRPRVPCRSRAWATICAARAALRREAEQAVRDRGLAPTSPFWVPAERAATDPGV